MKPKYTDERRYPNGYRPSHETNIRATFQRIRREQKERAAVNPPLPLFRKVENKR